MIPAALSDPNIAFLLVVIGTLALYWELHAPGMLVPGLIGIALICAGAYGLFQGSPTWYGAALLTLAFVLLFVELKYYTHFISGLTGTVLLAFGAVLLFTGAQRIAPWVAVGVSAAFGLITVFLGILGMRARKSKPLMGAQNLVGVIGEARTELNPNGSVMINGEYWQAVSEHQVAAGHKVAVVAVKGLVLQVKEI